LLVAGNEIPVNKTQDEFAVIPDFSPWNMKEGLVGLYDGSPVHESRFFYEDPFLFRN